MLPRTRLIKFLIKDLKETEEYLAEKLSCMEHKQPNGLSYHHGEVIKSLDISTLRREIKDTKEKIDQANKLPKDAELNDCQSICSFS